MYHSTGFTKAQIAKLCEKIEARGIKPGMRPWPPILGLNNALTVTLTYVRRNRVQEEIAENYGVSQPTISGAISAITPLLVQVLLECVPVADDLDDGRQFIVDGTLLPCWSWAARTPCSSHVSIAPTTGISSGSTRAMLRLAVFLEPSIILSTASSVSGNPGGLRKVL